MIRLATRRISRPSRRAGLLVAVVACVTLLLYAAATLVAARTHDHAAGGWAKADPNPVLGSGLGTVFDIAVLDEEGTFRMWLSWRPRKSIALAESADGQVWSEPVEVLLPDRSTGWEDTVNRPTVLRGADGYHMWYTGQTIDTSSIGHAVSQDGRAWERTGEGPVLLPTEPWEREALMAPHVLWDEQRQLFRMWYSGGEQYEPDAIGYAESSDGRTWEKRAAPVFTPSESGWDSHKVTAAQVLLHDGWHVMFYIGFRDVDHAQIGLARSRDGISGWERHPANPIIRPGTSNLHPLLQPYAPSRLARVLGSAYGQWDSEAVYKPFAVLRDDRWYLWYNGRRGTSEKIGLAIHEGADLGFDD